MDDLIKELKGLHVHCMFTEQYQVADLVGKAIEALSSQWVSVDCEWEYAAAEEYWKTSCGNAFALNDGSPEDNSFKHCCYCGGKLKPIEQEQEK